MNEPFASPPAGADASRPGPESGAAPRVAGPPRAGPRRGQTLDLDVQDLAFGGPGVAKVDGFVVFVENGLPGDRVRATVYRRRKQYAEARATEILSPAPGRVLAPCTHVGICGGCRLQELDYTEQLRHKERQVRECLAHLGRVEALVRPVIPAPRLFHYRNKMEYSFGADRDGALTLGLHRRGFFDRPFDLDRCHIATPISSEIVAFVRDFARAEGLPPYDLRRHTGLLRFLAVREAVRSGEVMVNIVASEPHPALETLATRLRERFPAVRSVLLNLTRRKAQVAVGEEERVLAGSRTIVERLHDLEFEISSNSFFQTNTEQAERLLDAALEGLALDGRETVLDLYSGTGTFTLPIARRAKEAIGIESSDVAVEDAERNAARNGITNARFVRGEAMEVLRDRYGLGEPPRGTPAPRPSLDAVLVDPPRAGLHPGVTTRLVHLGAPRVVYVSCNPATLARDLGLLTESRYRAEWVQPVDMFPHTPHIECVAVLTRSE
jgi:23S rRNA (uracil1939-C5)-methyltransferase